MSRFRKFLGGCVITAGGSTALLAANAQHENALRDRLSNIVETAKQIEPAAVESSDKEVDPKTFHSGLKLSLKESSDPMPQNMNYSLHAVSKNTPDRSGDGALTPGLYEIDVDVADQSVFRKQFIAIDGMQSSLELEYKKADGFAMRQTLDLPQLQFAPGQRKLVKPSFAALKSIVALLNREDGIELFGIEVHTDSGGVEEKNLELTEARAIEVRNYLVKNGVDAQRIRAQGFGSKKALAPNDTKENRLKNRRVEYVIVETSAKPRLLGDR
jgi:outer membrane protein OmpA-like peptidoglycan-associated protein